MTGDSPVLEILSILQIRWMLWAGSSRSTCAMHRFFPSKTFCLPSASALGFHQRRDDVDDEFPPLVVVSMLYITLEKPALPAKRLWFPATMNASCPFLPVP